MGDSSAFATMDGIEHPQEQNSQLLVLQQQLRREAEQRALEQPLRCEAEKRATDQAAAIEVLSRQIESLQSSFATLQQQKVDGDKARLDLQQELEQSRSQLEETRRESIQERERIAADEADRRAAEQQQFISSETARHVAEQEEAARLALH